jgi:histidine phosphotransfer protein HptB
MPTPINTSDNSLYSRLQELILETDAEFVLELIDLFLDEAPGQIQTISNALKSQDSQTLTISAHTLKGSSLNLGAKQLGAVCFKMEELGRSGKPIPAGTNTQAIETEFERVKVMLLTFKESHH